MTKKLLPQPTAPAPSYGVSRCSSIQLSAVLADYSVQRLQQLILALLLAPAALDGAPADPVPVLHTQVERLLDGDVVVEDVAAEVGGIIAVDAEADAGVDELPDGHLGDVLDAAQHDVAERARRQQDLLVGHALHQRRVLGEAPAVVNPGHAQPVERVLDEAGGPFLAGVGGAPQAQRAGPGVELLEQVRREGSLGRVQANACDVAAKVAGLHLLVLEGFKAVPGRQVAQKAADQLGRDAELAGGAGSGGTEALQHRVVGNAAGRVGLRIEEDFGMRNPVVCRVLEVIPGQRLEVRGVDEDGHANIVVVQEVVQGGEATAEQGRDQQGAATGIPDRRVTWGTGGTVGGSLPVVAGKEGLRRGECGVVAGEGNAVALGEGKQHLGRQGALKVDVLLALGERLEKREDLRLAHGWGSSEEEEGGKLNGCVERGNFWNCW